LQSCSDVVRPPSETMTLSAFQSINAKAVITTSSEEDIFVIPSADILPNSLSDKSSVIFGSSSKMVSEVCIRHVSVCVNPPIPGGLTVLMNAIETNQEFSNHLPSDLAKVSTQTQKSDVHASRYLFIHSFVRSFHGCVRFSRVRPFQCAQIRRRV
jgi:hypothetical protein